MTKHLSHDETRQSENRNQLLAVFHGAMRPLIGALIISSGAAMAQAPANAGDLAVSVTGVRSGGDVYVSVQNRGEFMQSSGSYGEIIRDVDGGQIDVTIKDVDPGDYAVSVWHDLDSDGEFDADENGMPLDGWSMSNASQLNGRPRFEQVQISIGGSDTEITLDMVYAN